MQTDLSQMRSSFFAACVVGLSILLTGCNQGPHTVPVHGTVKVNGEPLSEGVVMFYPTSGRPATGQIAEDGSYTLTTLEQGDGAMPGKYAVTIEAVEVTESAPAPKSLEEEIAAGAAGAQPQAKIKWLAPEEYADRTTTPLSATVVDGDNAIDFDIP